MKYLLIVSLGLSLVACGKEEEEIPINDLTVPESAVTVGEDGTIYTTPIQNYYTALKTADNVTSSSMACKGTDPILGLDSCNCNHAKAVISATVKHYTVGNRLYCECDAQTVQVKMAMYCAKPS
jgi:hypothetical protein